MNYLFGKDFLESIQHERLLLVGVGGIGCEILKQLGLAPFRHIEIVGLAQLRSIWTPLKSAI